MNSSPSIQADQHNGNLHIKLFGDFDQDFAKALTHTISNQYCGKGNIFVNTEKVERLLPDGQELFKKNLRSTILPNKQIYLIGEKGLEMGTRGCKVIIKKKKNCCGRCKNCSCHKNSTTKTEGEG